MRHIICIFLCIELLCSCNSIKRSRSISTKDDYKSKLVVLDSLSTTEISKSDETKKTISVNSDSFRDAESDVVLEFEKDTADGNTRLIIEHIGDNIIVTTSGNKPTKATYKKKLRNQNTKDSSVLFEKKTQIKQLRYTEKKQKDSSVTIKGEYVDIRELSRQRIGLGILIMSVVIIIAGVGMWWTDRKFMNAKNKIDGTS